MRLPENIERFVKNRKPHVTAGADIDNRVLDDSFAAMEETMRAKSVVNQPSIRRIIMKSRITKLAALAAAAVIIIAVLIGVNYFGGSVDMAGVAWGGVIEKIEQIPTVVYKITSVTSYPGENREMSTKSDIYDGGAYGRRMDMYKNGVLSVQKFILVEKKIAYFIWPKKKQYTRFALTDDQATTKEDLPRQYVKSILSEDYTKLGHGNINGIEVEGVEVNKSKLPGGDKDVIRLWVDIETNLPIRIELECMMMESGAQRPTKQVIDDFQWDVEIDTSVFEPNIPGDFTQVEPR